jgi:hypothetical protein
MPREQLVQSGSGMIGDAAQRVGEPSLRIVLDLHDLIAGGEGPFGEGILCAGYA